AFDELVSVIDVEHQDPGAAVLQVVAAADTWQRGVEEFLPLLCARRHDEDDERDSDDRAKACHACNYSPPGLFVPGCHGLRPEGQPPRPVEHHATTVSA